MPSSRSSRSRPRPPPTETTPSSVVRAYIARINAHDPEGLARLGTGRVRFVDALGEAHHLSRESWASFFESFPDYRVRAERVLAQGATVAVFGTASGSYRGRGSGTPGATWRFPAAWCARVRGSRLTEWRVYGDIEPMLKSAGLARS